VKIRNKILVFGYLAFLGLTAGAAAQDPAFPQKSAIEITVLFPPGSSADVTARLLADGMGRQLGMNVIVFNRPGAGGAIGYRYVAGQKPDGYSLVWNSNSISTTYHSGLLPFNYEAFEAVARALVESPVIAVRGDHPVFSLFYRVHNHVGIKDRHVLVVHLWLATAQEVG